MIERPSQISCMPVSAVIHVMVISLFFLIHLKKHKKKSSDRVLLSKVSPPGWEETRFFSLTLLPK